MILEPELICNRCHSAVYAGQIEIIREHVVLCYLDLAHSPNVYHYLIASGPSSYIYCKVYGDAGTMFIYSYKDKTLVVTYNSDGHEMARFGGYDSDFRNVWQMLRSWKHRIQNENDL